MRTYKLTFALCALCLLLSSCGSTKKGNGEVVIASEPVGPTFVADSAYYFCQQQCDFGPRTMNSDVHERCGTWIADKFMSYGMEVSLQKADLRGYDGTILKSTNIIAAYRPQLQDRILLCAHWDSRPWADNDPDKANHRQPVMAANDGASGVAVMLEVARLLQNDSLPIGVDFVCFDAEDWGTPQWAEDTSHDADTWALGAQHWAASIAAARTASSSASSAASSPVGSSASASSAAAPPVGSSSASSAAPVGSSASASSAVPVGSSASVGYAAAVPQPHYRFGILLDMVGGQGARFYQEQASLFFAPAIVKKVWNAAEVLGFSSFFPKEEGAPITDDHIPVNQKAGIPCIDIIPYYPDCEASSFGPTWHTVSDDMQHIDRNTLQAVGQTIIQVLFSEQ